MTEHHQHMYGTETVIHWSQLPLVQTVQNPQVYDVSFLCTIKLFPCPFPGCLESYRTWNGLCSRFNRNHWRYMIRILEEHPNSLSRCTWCGRQVPTGRINNFNYILEKCN